MNILIGLFDEAKLNLGTATWKGNSFEDIKNTFGILLSEGIESSKGIAYFSTSANNQKNAYEIDVQRVEFTINSLTVVFSVAGILDIKSIDIRGKAQRILRGQKILATDKYLPYFSILNEKQFKRLITADTYKQEIELLTSKNDWHTIYEKFGTIQDIKSTPEIWEEDQILSGISFATAKLSETSIHLRHAFKTDAEKDSFLKQQKHFREITELLRLRCIEISPNFASYYSNLAYSHYQYTRELTQPGGRRDGNAKQEAEKALEYLEKALSINPKRTNDHYRKGQILTEMLPKMLLFSRKSVINKELVEKVNDIIKEGILAFENVIHIYKNIPDSETKEKQRAFKDYVKSCYDVARSYGDLIINDWDEMVFLLGLDKDIEETDNISFYPKDLESTEKAIAYISEAIQHDCPNSSPSTEPEDLIQMASHNGFLEGVYKLYSLGKYYFQKYWVISCYGQRSNASSDFAIKNSEAFLLAALNFPWSDEKEKSDKSYIAERLCRLYVAKKKYDKAIDVLQPFLKKRTDYYIRYSIAGAMIMAGRYSEAEFQLKNALEDEKGNKEIWLGHFLNAISTLRAKNTNDSKKHLEKAIEIASKDDKHNLDSLLITQGYIAIKEGAKEDALAFFKQAVEMNPYRASIQKRVPGWEKPSQE